MKADWDRAWRKSGTCRVCVQRKAHSLLGMALGAKGGSDGAIAEEREATRVNHNNDRARSRFGFALGAKGNWDVDIGEQREAPRLNRDYDRAHYNLGIALKQKGDREGALHEFGAVRLVDPKNPDYQQAYERVLQGVNH